LINVFTSGTRAIDASSLVPWLSAGGGLDKEDLSAMLLVLGCKSSGEKLEQCQKLCDVLTLRKDRLAANAAASTVVTSAVINRNLACLNEPRLDGTWDTERKIAMLLCARFVLFEAKRSIYGGFVRDCILQDDCMARGRRLGCLLSHGAAACRPRLLALRPGSTDLARSMWKNPRGSLSMKFQLCIQTAHFVWSSSAARIQGAICKGRQGQFQPELRRP